MGKKLTKDEFIERSKKIHGDKYDYSLVEYMGSHFLVKIVCEEHGIFEQVPYQHTNGCGCPDCAGVKKLTLNDFISRSRLKHSDKYNYSNVSYINNRTKVKIICPDHGEFEQIAEIHMSGFGCPKCSNCNKKTTVDFIEKSKSIHEDKYDYSKSFYSGAHKKVIIICPDHGEFEQTPNSHFKGSGCISCNNSKGENKISSLLTMNNIEFETQKRFNGCNNINPLFFDFYLPKHNICIEYDGEQHFTKYRFEKNEDKFEIRKKRDQIKTNFCIENDIKLIRISYKENIEEKLKWMLNLIN